MGNHDNLILKIFINKTGNFNSNKTRKINRYPNIKEYLDVIIKSYINNNIYVKLTLSDVAKHMYLSPKQVSRIIEKEYGCTFSNLITEKRLAVAAVMLKNTDLKISEIAAQTFYGTETYFYSLFKSKYGISPLKYRQEVRILDKQNQ